MLDYKLKALDGTMSYQFEKVKILVVEDNQPMLELAKTLLNTFGVNDIYTARDGDEGFDVYCKENPDLILSDWMMRRVDGISLARRIRNDSLGPNQFVPFILMTGFSEKRRVVQARDVGITEFLVKPFTARDLYRRVVQIIEKPRPFIRSENFFGPDRRRKVIEDYQGPHRRESDGGASLGNFTGREFVDKLESVSGGDYNINVKEK